MSVQKNNNIVQLLFSFGAGITFIHEKLTVWHSCNGSTVQRLKTNAAEGFFFTQHEHSQYFYTYAKYDNILDIS